eukprot:7380233-Prymnesium_polylepis.4
MCNTYFCVILFKQGVRHRHGTTVNPKCSPLDHRSIAQEVAGLKSQHSARNVYGTRLVINESRLPKSHNASVHDECCVQFRCRHGYATALRVANVGSCPHDGAVQKMQATAVHDDSPEKLQRGDGDGWRPFAQRE